MRLRRKSEAPAGVLVELRFAADGSPYFMFPPGPCRREDRGFAQRWLLAMHEQCRREPWGTT